MQYSFGNLDMWGKGALETMNRQRREIAIRLFRSVIMDTPVEEGTLRGAWRIGVGGPPPGEGSGGDPVQSMITGVNSSQLEDSLYLINRLPYAPVVEYGLYPSPPVGGEGKTENGFSRKAPEGMVRKNVMRFTKIAESVARANR